MAALKAPKYPIPLTAEMRQQADQELEARGEEPDWPGTIQNYEAAFRDATDREYEPRSLTIELRQFVAGMGQDFADCLDAIDSGQAFADGEGCRWMVWK